MEVEPVLPTLEQSRCFMFIDGEIWVPASPPATWTDATLIEYIDLFEADLANFDEDALIPWTPSTDVFMAAWIELHKRTEA